MKPGFVQRLPKITKPVVEKDTKKLFKDADDLTKLPKNDNARKDKEKRENKLADLLDKKVDLQEQINTVLDTL